MKFQGIIAGIGNRTNKKNLITPQFDARVNKFIIGDDCIIDGLELVGDVLKTMKPGVCFAQGYRGEVSADILLDKTTYVYGVFKVNFDSDVPDSFYIETSSTPIYEHNDILHGAGIYYLLLYKNGVAQLSRKYPSDAVLSDNTGHINDYGTIGENVTAPTPPIGDNSKKVATTQYVHSLIVEKINADTDDMQISISYKPSSASIKATNITGTVKIKRKAKLAIFESSELSGSFNAGLAANTSIGTLPNGYVPKIQTSAIMVLEGKAYTGTGTTTTTIIVPVTLNTNGTITPKTAVANPYDAFSVSSGILYGGYETN